MPRRSTAFGSFIRNLYEIRGLTQEELGNQVGITKFQVSHIVTTCRGVSVETLGRMLDVLKLTPNELSQLRDICYQEGIGNLPPVLWQAIPLELEIGLQQRFKTIHVVSQLPLEADRIGADNSFLGNLVKTLSDDCNSNVATPAQEYVYWIPKGTVPTMLHMALYLERQGIPPDYLRQAIKIVESPVELCLDNKAIGAESKINGDMQWWGRKCIGVPGDRHARVVDLGGPSSAMVGAFLAQKLSFLALLPNSTDGVYSLHRVP